MRWDRFFDDLEDQVASEWEAERAALDTEAERLRLSTLGFAARLRALAPGSPDARGVEVTIDAASDRLRGTVTSAGSDWLALDLAESATVAALVPFAAVRGLALTHAAMLATARPAERPPGLRDRMTFGFVLRDLVRRRLAVTVNLHDGAALSGTIDRAGADHLDLALHEPGSPRRAASVTGFRMIPFDAVAWVRLEAAAVLR